MPHLHQALAATRGFDIASSLDLHSSFHQFSVKESDRDKTTFTHKGKRWRWARWPFGLSPASLRFQKVMEVVLDGLEGFVTIWIDDILIHTKGSAEKHAEQVRRVLQRLNKHNLRINPDKCHFGYKRVLMLGHMISGKTRELDPIKAESAAAWPEPSTGKEVQRFLGFANFVRDYIPGYASTASDLEPLKKRRKFNLDDFPLARIAFERIKAKLASAPVLSQADPKRPLIVATDASRHGLGAILYQEGEDGKRKFISFASTSLKGAQKNYGATKRELLGIIFAIRTFHTYVYGRQFTLFTDHKALTALFTVKRLSYVLQDWIDTLLQYSFEPIHRPGTELVMPDALSRMFNADCEKREAAGAKTIRKLTRALSMMFVGGRRRSASGTKRSIRVRTRAQRLQAERAARAAEERLGREAQQPQPAAAAPENEPASSDSEGGAASESEDEDNAQLKEAMEKAKRNVMAGNAPRAARPLPPRKLTRPIRIDELAAYPNRELAKFISERHLKRLPPEKDRHDILSRAHTTVHYGAEALYKTVWRDGWFWPTMRKDCREAVAFCRECIAYNVGREGFHPLKSLEAEGVFDHMAVDTLELPESEGGMNYVLIVVDVRSRYLITKALPDKSMATMGRALYETFTLFGPPKIMQSDNGTEYVNRLVEELCTQAGVDKRRVAPWNPRANGLAESFVKKVKVALKKILGGDFDCWDKALPGLTFAINTHEGKRSKTAAFTWLFNRKANGWQDYTLAELLGPAAEVMEEELEKLPDYENVGELEQDRAQNALLASAVFAPLSKAVANRQQKANAFLDTQRKSIVKHYPKGATVFIVNEDITSKLDPLFVGPFYVRKRNRNGAYKLKDQVGEKLARPVPVTKLKWVSDKDATLYDNEGAPIEKAQPRGVVDKILKTKKDKGQTLFLVQWKNSSERNQWLAAKAFDDPSFLIDYFRKGKKRRRKEESDEEAEGRAKPKPKNAKKRAKRKAPRGDLTGTELQVPAIWFGVDYAKQRYGKNYKRAKEHAVVQGKDPDTTKWLIVQPREDQFDGEHPQPMSKNAVIEYTVQPENGSD
jgi:transposase InsO family protein